MSKQQLVSAVILVAFSGGVASAGRVVAIGDEYILSNNAFTSNGAAATQLATQLAGFIGNNQPNRDFLVLTWIGQLGQSSLSSTMTGLGHTWTINGSAPLTLATLQQYDAVFFSNATGSGAGNVPLLTQYVNGGGSVVVVGGTGGPGGASNEAAVWNSFLNTYGLQLNAPFAGPQSGIQLPIAPNTNPVGAGLGSMYWSYGHTVTELNPNDPNTDVFFGDFSVPGTPPDLRGVIGTYDPIPAPGTGAAFLAAGLLGLRRRRT